MKKKILNSSWALTGLAFVLPLAASAQVVATGAPGIEDWLGLLGNLLRWAFPALITVAIFFLLWNVVQYIIKKDQDAGASKALAKKIGVSILALVAVLAIWGIMAFISSTLNLGIGGKINDDFIPGVQEFTPLPWETP